MTAKIDTVLRPLRESDLALVYKSWIGVSWEHWRWSTGRCKKCQARFTFIGRDAFSDGMHGRITRLLSRAQSAVITRADKLETDWAMGFVVWEPQILHAIYLQRNWRRMGIASDVVSQIFPISCNLGLRIQTPPELAKIQIHPDPGSNPQQDPQPASMPPAEDSAFPSNTTLLRPESTKIQSSNPSKTQENAVISRRLDTPPGSKGVGPQIDGGLGAVGDSKPPLFLFTHDSRAMSVMRKKWQCAYNPFLVEG